MKLGDIRRLFYFSSVAVVDKKLIISLSKKVDDPDCCWGSQGFFDGKEKKLSKLIEISSKISYYYEINKPVRLVFYGVVNCKDFMVPPLIDPVEFDRKKREEMSQREMSVEAQQIYFRNRNNPLQAVRELFDAYEERRPKPKVLNMDDLLSWKKMLKIHRAISKKFGYEVEITEPKLKKGDCGYIEVFLPDEKLPEPLVIEGDIKDKLAELIRLCGGMENEYNIARGYSNLVFYGRGQTEL